MLQDLAYGKLDIVYEDRRPQPEDLVICIRQDQVLVKRDSDNCLRLPTCREVLTWSKDWEAWGEVSLRYAFCLQERRIAR